MTPRGKDLLVEYVVRDLRGQERHGQLLTVKGTPFKTVTAAKAYRAKLPAGTEFDPALFGVYAVGTRKNTSNQCFSIINFRL